MKVQMLKHFDVNDKNVASLLRRLGKLISDKVVFAWWLMRLNSEHPLRALMRGFLMHARIAASGLFDAEWYRNRYPDVAQANHDPLNHFVTFGTLERRDPNPLFNSNWYLARYPDVAGAKRNPLDHFLTAGAQEGRDPTAWFDTKTYLAQHPEAARANINPLLHFLSTGAVQELVPNNHNKSKKTELGRANGKVSMVDKNVDLLSIEATHRLWRLPGSLYFLLEFGAKDASAIVSLLSDFQLLHQNPTDRVDYDSTQIDNWMRKIAVLAANREVDGTNTSIDVSIIIPVHNQLRHTLCCLASLVSWPTHATFEVIVADDASTDETANAVRALPFPFRLVSHADNVGFLHNCNRAARSATGKFIAFLNNDTLVLPGWLDALVETFKRNATAGLVGSKLLYTNGVLQEAGGLIWKDGSGWNIGVGEDPRTPSFNFCREVDYCSGASIALRRALWTELGGFDERYAPAYYEDTDLAFRVRQAGYKVLYQPMSQLIHFEGKSHGTDLTANVKRHQVINQATFFNTWKSQLAEHTGRTKVDPYCLGRFTQHHLLYIDAFIPTPDQDSGSVDAVNFLKMTKELGFHVTFLPTDSARHTGRYTCDLQKIGIECLYDGVAASPIPWLEQHGSTISLVILSRFSVALRFLTPVRQYCPNAKVIFNTVDLNFLREERQASVRGGDEDQLRLLQVQNMELEVINNSDAVVVVSETEQRLLDELAPSANTVYLPLPREIPENVADSTPMEIVFIGGYKHLPNVDGARYFVQDIWPLVRAQVPNARVVLAGSNMPEEVAALAGNGVETVGYVSDLAALFARARLSVAPLQYGAGQKGKVVTSLSYGVPVVATSVAAGGMELTDGQHLLIADSPATFADAVVCLLQDDELWRRLSTDGHRKVSDTFGYATVAKKLEKLVCNLVPSIDKTTEMALTQADEVLPTSPPPSLMKALANRLKKGDFQSTSFQNFDAFQEMLRAHRVENTCRQTFERALIATDPGKPFNFSTGCWVCGSFSDLYVNNNNNHGSPEPESLPNWREQLVCSGCSLNNRMRATLHLLDAMIEHKTEVDIYFTEQVTALYKAAKTCFPKAIGSEYLRDGTLSGQLNKDGVRHEDVTNLTFTDGYFDALVTLDVLEHVPDTLSALREFARVLKPGGTMILTAPFRIDRQQTLVRAKVDSNGHIEHLEEPEYHGDPMDKGGVLCFYHFGWDLLDALRDAGFAEATVVSYWSVRWGYLGLGQTQFIAVKDI